MTRLALYLVGAVLLIVATAEAGVLCTLFGRCLYESPGFRIIVLDTVTRRPVSGAHALAEWRSYAVGRRDGPLMVQDATSGNDGVLDFAAWGPIRGYRDGLVLNSDPVITLLKPGYRPLVINNAYPSDAKETDQVHGLGQNGETFALEPFRGSREQWVMELDRIAFGFAVSRSPEQSRQFRIPYLNRMRLVLAEIRTMPPDSKRAADLISSLEQGIKLSEGAPQ